MYQQTYKKPYRDLLHIGLPIILGQVGVILVSFIDNIMVGHYSTEHFAAASFVNNVYAVVYVIGIGFAYGLTPLITTAYTRRQYYKAGIVLRQSLVINILLGLFLALVMGVGYFYLEQTDLPTELLPIARPYYLLQLLSFIFFMAFGAFKQFFDGAGYTKIGMWVIIGANILNIVGNTLLIYGFIGFPEWGLFGAGLATLISRIFTLVVFLFCFYRLKKFTLSKNGFHSTLWSRQNSLRLVKLGVPVALYSGVETASFTIALIFVTQLGMLPLAVHQILCVVTTIGFFIYYGLGAATTILVSRNKAVGDNTAARASLAVGMELGIASAFIAMAIMFFARHWIGYIFTKDEAIIEMVSIALIPVILYQIGDAMQVIYANALRGMQDVSFLAVSASLIHLCLEPILSYTFSNSLGLEEPVNKLTAIWMAFPIGLLLLGLLLRYRFRKITLV